MGITGRLPEFPSPAAISRPLKSVPPAKPHPYAGPASPAPCRSRPCSPLTWRVQPKTPIMSIATVRYSASTSHQGLSNLKAGCCSENCLNSATGIILPMGEEKAGCRDSQAESLVVGPLGARHKPLLWIRVLPCPNLAEPRNCVYPSPLPQISPPSWSQASTVYTTSAPQDLYSGMKLPALSELRRGCPQGRCPLASACDHLASSRTPASPTLDTRGA